MPSLSDIMSLWVCAALQQDTAQENSLLASHQDFVTSNQCTPQLQGIAGRRLAQHPDTATGSNSGGSAGADCAVAPSFNPLQCTTFFQANCSRTGGGVSTAGGFFVGFGHTRGQGTLT